MTVLGATGHQNIPAAARDQVVREIRSAVRDTSSPLRLVTSLAAGSDQLVAREVVAAGGALDVVLPCRHYEETFPDAAHLRGFNRLLRQAANVERLDFDEPSEEAFWAAGQRVVDRCELLVAIWDGAPARGLGGTADVVRYARERNIDVRVIWPAGVAR